jgi:uncharacterized membrane protein
MPDPTATIESANTIFTYFSPAKSPYYSIGLASCVGLFYACDIPVRGMWLWVSVPVFLVTFLTLLLSIDSKNNLTEAEHAEQLRFSRSTCISVAVLALSFGGKDIASKGASQMFNFTVTVSICCIQIAIFLIFNWALNKRDLPTVDRNYVQITLLTSAFLGDTCVNLAYATHAGDADSGVTKYHQDTAYALGTLWAFCIVFWIVTLVRLRVITIQRPGAAGLGGSAQP